MGKRSGNGLCREEKGKKQSCVMKKTLLIPVIILLLLSCTNTVKEKIEKNDSKVVLRVDTVNVVKLTDTLIIYQSVCRGCAYEQSTHFEINDSLGVIQLIDVITKDNNPPDVNGGSISKNLLLKPVKTGVTK